MFILITGGSCSGKSAYAESRIQGFAADHNIYLATMQVYDRESEERVRRHREMRAGKDFKTVERSRDLPRSFAEIEAVRKDASESRAVLLECLSNLAANEMFRDGEILPAPYITKKVTGEVMALRDLVEDLVVVTNNIFEDGGDYDETTLSYMRALGDIASGLALGADEVYEVVCGIPVRLK